MALTTYASDATNQVKLGEFLDELYRTPAPGEDVEAPSKLEFVAAGLGYIIGDNLGVPLPKDNLRGKGYRTVELDAGSILVRSSLEVEFPFSGPHAETFGYALLSWQVADEARYFPPLLLEAEKAISNGQTASDELVMMERALHRLLQPDVRVLH